MKLKKQQLRVFDIYPCCEKCNEIMLENKNIMNGGKITYTCPKCKSNYVTKEKYPKRVFEKMGNPILINN